MTAGWAAGTVRSRALVRRRLGPDGARAIASADGLDDALRLLAGSVYGRRATPDLPLDAAQHAVWATTLWNLRVLAGWLPSDGVLALRAAMGWFEVRNVDEHLLELTTGAASAPFELGRMRTAWPRLAGTTSAGEVNEVLATSGWAERHAPGADPSRPDAMQLRMRSTLARRVARLAPDASGWAATALLLLVARERLLLARPVDAFPPAVAQLVGAEAVAATSLAALRAAVPPRLRWVLADAADETELWRAEIRWWQQVELDAQAGLRRSGSGLSVLCGTVALLAVDAWRTCAALASAAYGDLDASTIGVDASASGVAGLR